MKSVYEIVKSNFLSVQSEILKRTDEDGTIYWIPIDESNSDYQVWLKRDEAKTE